VARIVVQHDVDPAIGIVLEIVPQDTPGRAQGTHGTCTECGWKLHRWVAENAVKDAQHHVDRHESSL
jgi:hypothetical protein